MKKDSLKTMRVTSLALLGLCSASAFAPIRPLQGRMMLSVLSMSAPVETTEGTVQPQLNKQEERVEDFENDGMFSWMIPYLGMIGMNDGRTLKYGFLTSDADEKQQLSSPEEAAAARRQAISKMTNIGTEERQRRDQAGDVMIPLTAAYAVFSSLLLDDGSINGHLARFAIVLPLFLSRGYKLSAEVGL